MKRYTYYGKQFSYQGAPAGYGSVVPGYNGYRYFICKRRKFQKQQEEHIVRRSFGTWNFDLERGYLRVYVSCPACGAPNDISGWYFLDDGRVSGYCIICKVCNAHSFPMLEGWDAADGLKINTRCRVPRRKRKVKS